MCKLVYNVKSKTNCRSTRWKWKECPSNFNRCKHPVLPTGWIGKIYQILRPSKVYMRISEQSLLTLGIYTASAVQPTWWTPMMHLPTAIILLGNSKTRSHGIPYGRGKQTHCATFIEKHTRVFLFQGSTSLSILSSHHWLYPLLF